ncbi:MAG TPA: type I secretion system permease/ATPase [Microvirga sp.]|jgi:PrtD family type I secretion system ABC transporter|nr:type I secretion system permease/ATPase [Microvirga sp.]
MFEFSLVANRLRQAIIAVFALSSIISLLMLALPVYMMQISIRVLPSESEATLLVLSLMALAAFAACAALEAVRQMILSREAVRFEALLAGPFVYAHFSDPGRDSQAGLELLNDIRTVRSFIASRVPAALAEAPYIPLFLLALFLVDFSLGAVVAIGMVVMIVLALLQQNAVARPTEESIEAERASRRTLQSHLAEAETVRVLGLHQTAINRWGQSNALALARFLEIHKAANWYNGFSKVVRLALQAGILGFGALLVLEGKTTMAVVFACTMIGGRILAPLDGLVGSWTTIAQTLVAYNRIKAAAAELVVDPPRMALPAPTGRIMLEKVVYRTPASDQLIIKPTSLEIKAGETIGLIGPNGAGKSTLLKLMAGAIMPLAGSVRFDGADLRTWNRVQLGAYVGYVPQSIEFFPGTVAENIARFDPEAKADDIVEASQLAGVHNLILRFPDAYDTKLGGTFRPSGGQRQLLGLARAFYKRPRLLFLDEPNSNLDQEGDQILFAALGRAREWGATIVVITQRPVLIQIVDRVLMMNDGMVQAFGPKDEVLPKVVKPVAAVRKPSPALPPQAAAAATGG